MNRLTNYLIFLCTTSWLFSAPDLTMEAIKAHQQHIAFKVKTKNILKNGFNICIATAVCYAGYKSIFGNFTDTQITSQLRTHVSQEDHLQSIDLGIRNLVETSNAKDPRGRHLIPWFWSTDEARTVVRKFALATTITILAHRCGILELYLELLGKQSPYDNINLFLEEKTRITQLLASLEHYTTCYTRNNISLTDQTYCNDSLKNTLTHLAKQFEYLLGYMYYRSGTNYYKKRAVDTMMRDITYFYATIQLHLDEEEHRAQLQTAVQQFCSWFNNEITNFANLDALA